MEQYPQNHFQIRFFCFLFMWMSFLASFSVHGSNKGFPTHKEMTDREMEDKIRKFYGELNRNSNLPANHKNKMVRGAAVKGPGEVRGSGLHEIFKTSDTQVWHALSHGKDLPESASARLPDAYKNKTRLPSVMVDGEKITYLDAQANIRIPTKDIIFKDGSAHSGALYSQRTGRAGGITCAQDQFHEGQSEAVMKSGNALTASIRGLRHQINNTLSAGEFMDGIFEKKRKQLEGKRSKIEGIFNVRAQNLLNSAEKREAAKEYIRARNRDKENLRRLEELNQKKNFVAYGNDPDTHSMCDSEVVSAMDEYDSATGRIGKIGKGVRPDSEGQLVDQDNNPVLVNGEKVSINDNQHQKDFLEGNNILVDAVVGKMSVWKGPRQLRAPMKNLKAPALKKPRTDSRAPEDEMDNDGQNRNEADGEIETDNETEDDPEHHDEGEGEDGSSSDASDGE